MGRHEAAPPCAPPALAAPPPVGPSWLGGFTPFSVGDPGCAALTVKPAPDPESWDRRDTVLDGLTVKDPAGQPVLELRAASVRGLSHRYYGKVRQDEYAFLGSADGRFLVAAVADGMSVGKFSHHAAKLVTRHGCARLAEFLRGGLPPDIPWTEILQQLANLVLAKGRELLRPQLDEHEVDALGPRELANYLAATALFVVVDLGTDGAELPAYVLALGDTSAWVLRAGSQWENQQPVTNAGAVIASGTWAIPLVPTEVGPAVRTTIRPGDALLLMSDGVGDPLGDGTGAVGEFLGAVWSQPPAPLAFAAQVEFARKSFDDDRTAIVLWPLARS